jgi:hypothetical protein
MPFTKITGVRKQDSYIAGVDNNSFVRASEFNRLIDEIETEETLSQIIDANGLNNLGDFADDAAAAVGLVPIGGLYRTTSTIKVRVA